MLLHHGHTRSRVPRQIISFRSGYPNNGDDFPVSGWEGAQGGGWFEGLLNEECGITASEMGVGFPIPCIVNIGEWRSDGWLDPPGSTGISIDNDLELRDLDALCKT